jgi:RNA polymerase sigma-70 factor (ECF subfamily)
MDPRLGGRVDPSDVLQEAFVDAMRQLPNYLRRPNVALYVWLRGLTSKRLLKLHRRHLRAHCRAVDREWTLPPDSSAALARQLIGSDTSPSQAMIQDELRQRVQAALARLRDDDREVILMRQFEDMSNGEVAQALNLSDAAATMRYGRALYRLKELLLADGIGGAAPS